MHASPKKMKYALYYQKLSCIDITIPPDGGPQTMCFAIQIFKFCNPTFQIQHVQVTKLHQIWNKNKKKPNQHVVDVMNMHIF